MKVEGELTNWCARGPDTGASIGGGRATRARLAPTLLVNL